MLSDAKNSPRKHCGPKPFRFSAFCWNFYSNGYIIINCTRRIPGGSVPTNPQAELYLWHRLVPSILHSVGKRCGPILTRRLRFAYCEPNQPHSLLTFCNRTLSRASRSPSGKPSCDLDWRCIKKNFMSRIPSHLQVHPNDI